MSILYEQILTSNEIIKAEDKKYPPKMLYEKFLDLLDANDFSIYESSSKSKAPIDIVVKDKNDNLYRLVIYLRNITGAGWEDKPQFKRVQVINVRYNQPDKYISTTKNQAMFILGYYNFDNNPIFVAWDLYRYTNHNTNRSCYVTINHLLTGYEKGFYEGVAAENIIWVFKEKYFSKFIDEYIKYVLEYREDKDE